MVREEGDREKISLYIYILISNFRDGADSLISTLYFYPFSFLLFIPFVHTCLAI